MIPELETADLEAILTPLAGDSATGTDLRLDATPTSLFSRLRDARRDARDAERQADSEGGEEGPPTLWRPVVTMAIDALKDNTKDLEIAAWLTEGLVRVAGLGGLEAGASVLGGLVERYWDDVFPSPEREEGVDLSKEEETRSRVFAIEGMCGQGKADGTLMQPLRKIVLFNRPDGQPFSIWQYQASCDLAGIVDPDRRAQRLNSGVLTFEDVEKEARMAGGAHWSAQRKAVSQALAAWRAMESLFDEKAGTASPSGKNVRELLEFIMGVCVQFAPEDDAPAADPGTGAEQPADAGGAVVAARASGAITSREQALQRLAEIATWFTRNAPGSPIGFTLEEAVRRARMGWPELVAELVNDDSTRRALLISVGLKPPPEAG